MIEMDPFTVVRETSAELEQLIVPALWAREVVGSIAFRLEEGRYVLWISEVLGSAVFTRGAAEAARDRVFAIAAALRSDAEVIATILPADGARMTWGARISMPTSGLARLAEAMGVLDEHERIVNRGRERMIDAQLTLRAAEDLLHGGLPDATRITSMTLSPEAVGERLAVIRLFRQRFDDPSAEVATRVAEVLELAPDTIYATGDAIHILGEGNVDAFVQRLESQFALRREARRMHEALGNDFRSLPATTQAERVDQALQFIAACPSVQIQREGLAQIGRAMGMMTAGHLLEQRVLPFLERIASLADERERSSAVVEVCRAAPHFTLLSPAGRMRLVEGIADAIGALPRALREPCVTALRDLTRLFVQTSQQQRVRDLSLDAAKRPEPAAPSSRRRSQGG